jgi:hypothetical protein
MEKVVARYRQKQQQDMETSHAEKLYDLHFSKNTYYYNGQEKDDGTQGVCSTHEVRNVYSVSVRQSEQ